MSFLIYPQLVQIPPVNSRLSAIIYLFTFVHLFLPRNFPERMNLAMTQIAFWNENEVDCKENDGRLAGSNSRNPRSNNVL